MSSYSSPERKDSLYFLWEKLSSLHIYLIRKIILGVLYVNLTVSYKVAKLLGFHVEASVGDREAWIWKPHRYVPLWRAYVKWERVDKQ